ncbi:MAG TPA: NADH:ubiquinone reductase (Na(+)-transporting) subunit C [bacterium]|nr:NADH:ubiquinone reductase (Na(+)-transporting) subunit C [bacterium]
MNTNSNSYTMMFAVAICVVMSTVLAFLANALEPTQKAAAEFDRQKNVMMAAGLIQPGDARSQEELQALFAERVTEVTIDVTTGEPLAGTPEEVAAARKSDPKRYRVVGTVTKPDGSVDAIILPISGKGLWSTLYGYLALEADRNHVKGIQFYKHGETPGLGGEVENPAWTALWKGKEIRDANGQIAITIKKGKVDEKVPAEKAHYVDGLSGATITSKGVQTFVRADLKAFDKYLSRGK